MRRVRPRPSGRVGTLVDNYVDDDDDDDLHGDDNNNDDDDNSDCSLESVDLSSHDNDDDEGRGTDETVRTAEEASLSDQSVHNFERTPAAKRKDSAEDVVGSDVPDFDNARTRQSSVSLDRVSHSPSTAGSTTGSTAGSTAGSTEIGSAVVSSAAGSDGPAYLESNVRRQIFRCRDGRSEGNDNEGRRTSVFDDLLFDIYDRWHAVWRESCDSDTFTDMTESDASFIGRNDWNPSETDGEKRRLNLSVLKAKDVCGLEQMISDVSYRINQMSSHLVRQLKCRERRLAAVREKCDIVTAILHASSLKRRIDSKIRFSIEPLPGEDAFGQWRDAMKAVARLPLGIPSEFRRNVWLALADNYVNGLCVDWEKTKRLAFNEKSNPDDSKLGLQIVKDLHRTGCSGFNGRDNEEDRAVLKRVLLAYARWNKSVGYCQGFNILAAFILDVVERKEECALKVMIYLIDRVLPESYFASNLRALSVDMAVFRDLLRGHLMQLSKHLDHLQNAAADQTTGASYEPPLTNVFTMQWFLTLFATCLPKATALHVWDSVLLEGSEILLRTAIAIWGTLESRILSIPSADEFYSSMGVLSQEMLDGKTVTAVKLMKDIYAMAPFPFPQLVELREKYTYNITPFTASVNSGRHQQQASMRSGATGVIFADDEDLDEDELIENINCFAGFFLSQHLSPSINASSDTETSSDVSKASPGAYAVTPVDISISSSAYSDRITLDINMLHRQYTRLKQRQKQAHIILATANARQKQLQMTRTGGQDQRMLPAVTGMMDSSAAVNHLFMSRQMLNSQSRNGCLSLRVSASVVDGYDDFRGRSSLSVPQQASDLPRGGKKFTTAHQSFKALHSNVGKTLVRSLAREARVRTDSTTSTNESEDGSVGCDSSSYTSLQSDKSCGSVGAEEAPKYRTGKQDSVDSSGSCDCITCGMPDNAVFESSLELDKTLCMQMNLDAVALVYAGADNTPAHGHKISVDGQNSLTINLPNSRDAIHNTQTRDVEIPVQSPKTCHRSSSEMMSSEPLGESVFNKTSVCNAVAADAIHKHTTDGTPLEHGRTAAEQKANCEVSRDKNPSLGTIVKGFNPFPRKNAHPRKTRGGVRLGLYSESDGEVIGGGQVKRSAEQLQRTAYLQRQYMMQLTHKSRLNKS